MPQPYYDLQEGPPDQAELDEQDYQESVEGIMGDIDLALRHARTKHPGAIHSAHEGYAVILEELDEVKAEVWRGAWRPWELYRELQHVAAMCIRMAADLYLLQRIEAGEDREREAPGI